MKWPKREKLKMLAVMLILTVGMNGCGHAGTSKQAAEKERKLTYIELTQVEDYYGDKSMYDVYAPKGNSNENGYIFYSDHGLNFGAYSMNYGSRESLMESLKVSIELKEEEWTEDNSEYTNVETGEILENGEDRYQVITAERADLYGIPYEVNLICYMDVQENGGGVLWDLELSEIGVDSETDFLIDELAQCYDLDLDFMKTSGKWAAANEARLAEEKKADSLPETILWFNATYAPLTYSNGCDWEEVGGMEPSEYNAEFNRKILERDWGIVDEASAMETVGRLREGGHREKCRECIEELEELGILEEKNQEDFLKALMDSGIEENLYRYVIAYGIHRSGLDADCIAAWDLCRVNQLYADFYICGYMTYEDAMDASLENSLVLQEMYSSWEDMVNSYLLGYQFWRSDPMLTDDSPTMKRYQCYLDLLEEEDGPYTLDWNTKLQKSW